MRLTPRRTAAASLAVVLVVAGAVAGWRVVMGARGMELTADFSRSTSVYLGNPVTVLGVTEGRVVGLEPDGAVVHVRMRLDRGVKVPADVKAALLSRSLVASREVALTPAYLGGPALADGGVIDQQHTFVPLEIDEILSNLQQLAVALGPQGANAKGAFGDFVLAANKALGGQGEKAHDTVVALAKALSVTDAHSADLAAVVTNLSSLTSALAAHDGTVRRFEGDLAAASGDLAADRATLASALARLSDALGRVGSLVHDHRAAVQADVHALAATTSALVAHQKQLAEAIDELPTFGQNLAQAIDPSGRVDMRFVNYNGTIQALPFGAQLCQLLGVCDLIPTGIPPLPRAER